MVLDTENGVVKPTDYMTFGKISALRGGEYLVEVYQAPSPPTTVRRSGT
jgi:hypothetical protein